MGTRILTTVLAVCSLWISSAQAQTSGYQPNNHGLIVNAVVVAPIIVAPPVNRMPIYLPAAHFETAGEARQAAAEHAAWLEINGPDTNDYQNRNAQPQTALILRRIVYRAVELKVSTHYDAATSYTLPIGCEIYLLTGMGRGGMFTIYVPSIKTTGFVHQNDLRSEVVR